MNDDASDASVAELRRSRWAARASWYVYGAFVALTYVGIFASPAVRALVTTRGSVTVRLQQIGEVIDELLFHDFDALPILFIAAAFPPIAGYVVRGFYLLIVARDASWIPVAAWMLALFSLASIGVKLALAGIRGSGLQRVIFSDLEYFCMNALPLFMAVLLAVLARFMKPKKIQ